jgi:deoxyribodipyrimidine photolyase-related protein
MGTRLGEREILFRALFPSKIRHMIGRLILGDQLNPQHSWFSQVEPDKLCYYLVEAFEELTYAPHHRQKMLGFLGAMRAFADHLRAQGHSVRYLSVKDRIQDIPAFLQSEKNAGHVTAWEAQEPDEYRLDQSLRPIVDRIVSSEHFLTERPDVATHFAGKKTYLMESFYRMMRKKTGILMEGDQPVGGQWNYDADNRQAWPKGHQAPPIPFFSHDLSDLDRELDEAGLPRWGDSRAAAFPWPLNREEALQVLDAFVADRLVHFGAYQDALVDHAPFLYHSLLSFALNTKMLQPLEVIQAAEDAYRRGKAPLNSVEGYIRQILGWREFVRGMYWAEMPEYGHLNFFQHEKPLPSWFYTGQTSMRCVAQAIQQSLSNAYAHHIQRLMVTGNLALLLGSHPNEVDQWYLGIYIDALEWVEQPNTRGMSQYADGGKLGSKPYVSSGAYLHKMSNHCASCRYKVREKTGPDACPFNALYWDFHDRHRDKLEKNPRIGMVYRTWDRMGTAQQTALLERAQWIHENVEDL